MVVFGSRNRTLLLVLIAGLGESYARELARTSGIPYSTAILALDKLEADQLIVGVQRGKERRLQLNPRFVANKELKSLLQALLLADPEAQQMLTKVRMRPRKKGKEL